MQLIMAHHMDGHSQNDSLFKLLKDAFMGMASATDCENVGT